MHHNRSRARGCGHSTLACGQVGDPQCCDKDPCEAPDLSGQYHLQRLTPDGASAAGKIWLADRTHKGGMQYEYRAVQYVDKGEHPQYQVLQDGLRFWEGTDTANDEEGGIELAQGEDVKIWFIDTSKKVCVLWKRG